MIAFWVDRVKDSRIQGGEESSPRLVEGARTHYSFILPLLRGGEVGFWKKIIRL